MTTWTSDQLTAIGNADELRHEGHVQAGGVDQDVSFAAETDPAVNDQIDAAYRAKYGGPYADAMVATGARATTLKLVPH